MAAWTVVAMTTMEKSVALMTAAIAGVEARLEKNLGYLALIGFCQWRLGFRDPYDTILNDRKENKRFIWKTLK